MAFTDIWPMSGFIYVVIDWAILKTYFLLFHRIVLYIVEDRILHLTWTHSFGLFIVVTFSIYQTISSWWAGNFILFCMSYSV